MNKLATITKIVRGLGVFTALSLTTSFINFIFGFVMIRVLAPGEFRDLTLANNLINIFGNIFVALNVLGIAVFYLNKEHQAAVMRACQKIIYILYALLLGLCVVFNTFVKQRTGIDDSLVLNLTLLIILCSIPVMVLNAIYVGGDRFSRSGLMGVVLALGRLVFGLIGALLVVTHRDAASLTGILLIYVVAFAGFMIIDNAASRHKSMVVFRGIWKATLGILGTYRKLVVACLIYAVSISFLLGLDILMFGRYFSDGASAHYAAISVVGKLVFFFLAPISLYLAGKQQALEASGKHVARRVSLVVSGLIVLTAITLMNLPPQIYSALLHRPIGEIDQSLLALSVIFNAAVVLTNHHLIEAIVCRRTMLAILMSSTLLITAVGFFALYESTGLSHNANQNALTLGLPAVFMTGASIILFFVTHLSPPKPVVVESD